MKTKHIITTVVVIVVAAIAYGIYAMRTAQAPAPSPAANAKINIDEVCEGALAYTTFTDGATAEAYVQDCKDGKHPEVIEQYIKNLGLDGAQI